MGNAQSDQGEREAHEVIKHIPFVGPAYSGVRAAVYAGKGNDEEARRSGIAMGFGTLQAAATFVPGGSVVSGAATAALHQGGK
ncbi:hypothetical protein FRB94_005589 [Tulasnella sp. JGI-2019a]|nr:hypothetical protein FRB93_003913 [Tulasnella sp. JGI-2019a]KAG9000274.1 hypothetical protein FRB94_005589 [Tulasnella sp. JGI-2019a]KAG9033652.1 hypothetical protein FRB95_014540 [Tulasnella sp. JGI-2019a]